MYDIFERLLKERGVLTVEVCKATGISQSTISNWKNRGNMLSPNNLKKIADFFGVSLDYMMGASDIETDAQEILDQEYYFDEKSKELAEFLHKNPDYSVLFDATRKVKPEDIKKALKAIGIFIDEE